MKILGIDPGSRNLGYAIIELNNSHMKLIEAGLVKIKPSEFQYQLSQMIEGLDMVFSSHSVDEVAMEDIFYAYNPQTVLKLAQFRGALALRIIQLHGNFSEYTPLQVKKALTGKAKASKEQVAFMVKKLLGIKKEIKPLDITDAMAIAITHAQRLRLKR
ncbi:MULTISPECIES: crossover junction endodeoxyribonuclease RuvC [unclassified Nitratiruptor]|uniref:crossover junction endodeoxyribonuclease RuvC n=1 Tax=unclassified Nitratiruptor TaxID=2624044 RepID=UPI0019153F23|nr:MULTISPECIES: crossover junction endodeoxyribonuclease RuvC [unclassified Nitratiruptor]BCD61138.1 crossover junction endodeoxyribonuclease RuvC [Nitratiruptor sp. YY08-10]BCD65071.1 crossover junction endodeoxyribonuclease RuvC [Nitratiruptor sp. YY08-14]